MLGQAVPQREKQMEEPTSNKNEHNGAWDFQRCFQVKPNFDFTRNFRMRVPLPYCNSGIGYSVLIGGIQGVAIARRRGIMYTALQYLLRYLPGYRLLRVL